MVYKRRRNFLEFFFYLKHIEYFLLIEYFFGSGINTKRTSTKLLLTEQNVFNGLCFIQRCRLLPK